MSTTVETANTFSGEVATCAHHVTFNFWDFKSELTPELEAKLEEHAEGRAKECIVEGYTAGELNFCTQDEEEICGWWSIDRS